MGKVQNRENTDPQKVICPATVSALSVQLALLKAWNT